MKKLLYTAAAVLLISCNATKSTSSSQSSTPAKAPVVKEMDKKETAKELVKDASGNLSGVQTKWSYMQAPYGTWFTPRYEAYKPQESVVSELKDAMEGVSIRGYMGTWCGDSKRETPQFYKLMDALDFDYENLTMISVDRSKSKPVELVSGYDIKRVPTFIFYKNGKEIGRYVEYARESMEEDFLKIASGADYKHSYEK
ncbi:MAG: thioredoxin family protein [Nonlabens sp.]